MDLDALLAAREDAGEWSGSLGTKEIEELFCLLSEKNNDIRYAAFLALVKRSRTHGDVYPFWDELARKLNDDNSYQRSIGVMLLAENVRWDSENRLNAVWNSYKARFRDEKFITSRQAIQSLLVWLSIRPDLHADIANELTGIQVTDLPPTQRKLILKDIVEVLLVIRNTAPNDGADTYLAKALDSGLMDKKEKAVILSKMKKE